MTDFSLDVFSKVTYLDTNFQNFQNIENFQYGVFEGVEWDQKSQKALFKCSKRLFLRVFRCLLSVFVTIVHLKTKILEIIKRNEKIHNLVESELGLAKRSYLGVNKRGAPPIIIFISK